MDDIIRVLALVGACAIGLGLYLIFGDVVMIALGAGSFALLIWAARL